MAQHRGSLRACNPVSRVRIYLTSDLESASLPFLLLHRLKVNSESNLRSTFFQVSPVLKHKQQRGITSLAWRPFLASELAVGCLSGIFIWWEETDSSITWLHRWQRRVANVAPKALVWKMIWSRLKALLSRNHLYLWRRLLEFIIHLPSHSSGPSFLHWLPLN